MAGHLKKRAKNHLSSQTSDFLNKMKSAISEIAYEVTSSITMEITTSSEVVAKCTLSERLEFFRTLLINRRKHFLSAQDLGVNLKRNPWFGELWNIRYLPDASWNDLFGAEREEQEQRRSAHDRDVLIAKRHARQFTAALEATKLEKKLEVSKGKRFRSRQPIDLNKRQRLTESEILERLARSHRTPPEGSSGLSALSNRDFMTSLFSGGL